ncbi:unnamed protein product [Knipowitschia caucasica]
MKVFASGRRPLVWFICLLSLPAAACQNVRLWPAKCSGRLEVLHNGQWGTVCNDMWNKLNSVVVCRELACGPATDSTRSGAGRATGEIWLDDVKCKGNESSILSCQHNAMGNHNCDHSEDVSVVCSDPVRFSHSTDRCSGTLEVFKSSSWSTVCYNNWTPELSRATCQQLDCGLPKAANATVQTYKGLVSSCVGNVTSVSECTLTNSADMCQGVALSCTSFRDIRLVNGSDRCSGRVEVFFNKGWGTVCDDNWDMKDVQVACRAMDCGGPIEAKHHSFFGEGDGQIWLDNMDCAGNESNLADCTRNQLGDHNCGHSEDAGAVCSSHIRLINGTSGCSGRVEFSVGDQWSSARLSTWALKETVVVCREIDCGEAVSFSGSNTANEPLSIHDVTCKGTEGSLKECTIERYNRIKGDKSEDATVVCTGKVLLSDGPNRCAGRVEVHHSGQWADVCPDSFDMNDAQVLCKQLNCGSVHKVITSTGKMSAKLWVDDVGCSGNEFQFSMCPLQFRNKTCSSSVVAGVICGDGVVVRLSNGQDRCSGRVEVHHGDTWGTLCSSGWDVNKAKVLCDMLECGHVQNASITGVYPPGMGPVYNPTDACFNSLTSMHRCSLIGFPSSTCGHDKDISIKCGGDSSIRFVNGSDRCSGRVEILHNAKWGTICDDDWDIRDAQVVCLSKDCGTALMAVPGSFFGPGFDDIWLDDVNCLGNESSIVQCEHPDFSNHNCGHGEDAGVICSAHLRLLGGPDQCSGSVELYHDGEWLPAVNTNWGMNEATVICKEMNCGDIKSTTGSFLQKELQKGFKVSCTGRESSLSQCNVRAYAKTQPTEQLRYATVTCSGIVKLKDGPNRCAGRVEVFHKGRWGNVCGQSWDMNDAKVVCQQLNCGQAFNLTTDPSLYGHGTATFQVEHMECNGRESLLEQCSLVHGGKECNQSSVAAVICSDSLNIRLVEGSDRCTGRVDVRMGSVWGAVCGADWSVEKAEVVCELLDCGQAISVSTVPHKAAVPVSDPGAECFSSRQALQRCLTSGLPRSTCAQSQDASVSCAALVRLADGPHACSGRVEVFHKGEWGTVCNDDWDMDDVRVVCRQLGCGFPVSSSVDGSGKGQIWLDNVQCRGTEASIAQCTHNGWSNHNCGHEEDAWASCLDVLQKPKILLNPGAEVKWGDTASVTCAVSNHEARGTFTLRKLNSTFKMEKFSENLAAVFTLPFVSLNHSGSYYCQYRKNVGRDVNYFPEGDSMELTVKVSLDRPDILVTSLDPMIKSSLHNISISRGHSFNLTCSVRSIFPGGFFYIIKAKRKASESKAAVHQPEGDLVKSVFLFHNVQYVDKGDYSCVFGVNLSTQTFDSVPSPNIHITVVAGSSTSVALGVVIALLLLGVLLGVGYFVWKKRRWNTDSMVMFVNRLGGALQDIGNNVRAGAAVPHSFSNINVDMDGIEDPPGTVNNDHEPLVFSN